MLQSRSVTGPVTGAEGYLWAVFLSFVRSGCFLNGTRVERQASAAGGPSGGGSGAGRLSVLGGGGPCQVGAGRLYGLVGRNICIAGRVCVLATCCCL